MKTHFQIPNTIVAQLNSTCLAPGTGFVEDKFSMDQGVGWEVLISGRFKHITFIVHFISIIITSAPPQIIRHQIPEVGEP